jgi:hypothetical protein
MGLGVRLGALCALVISSVGSAADFDRSELPESAYTVGEGKMQIHADYYQSSIGITDYLDIRTRILPSYFGPNLAAKIAAIQKEDWGLSFEPGFWMEWPMAKLGSPSYSVGVMNRYSRTFGKHRFNFGVGLRYDVLKVTIRPIDSQGRPFDADNDQEFVKDKGIEVSYEYSLTMLRAPLHFHQEATKTDGGWTFKGMRMPIVLGYEVHTKKAGEVFNLVTRIRPLAMAAGGSWYAEIHPSYNRAFGDTFRLSVGLNILAPGMPPAIADDELQAEVDAKKEANEQDFYTFMNNIPMAGAPVFVIPTVALWWRI